MEHESEEQGGTGGDGRGPRTKHAGRAIIVAAAPPPLASAATVPTPAADVTPPLLSPDAPTESAAVAAAAAVTPPLLSPDALTETAAAATAAATTVTPPLPSPDAPTETPAAATAAGATPPLLSPDTPTKTAAAAVATPPLLSPGAPTETAAAVAAAAAVPSQTTPAPPSPTFLNAALRPQPPQPFGLSATAATATASTATAAPACCTAMASLRVLAFDHEGGPVQFDTWLDDLHLYLLSNSKDSVSLFDLASGAAPTPPATADTQDSPGTVRCCSHPLLLACHCCSRPPASALPVPRAASLCHSRGPGLHLPSFSMNLVCTAALQDAMVTTTTPGGSSLYTLATEPSQVDASAQVSASGQVAASCSCRLLSHQTLLWDHRLGQPSLPRIRGMHSRLLSRERYILLVVDDYTRYTTVFPLHSKGQVVDVLIPWIRTVRIQLCERFGQDLPVLHLHSDRGGEFCSNLLRNFCHGEGILRSFTLPNSPQQNRIAERRIGLVMEVARTSMIHAAAPHFLWPFMVRYAAHQLNLWPRISLPETSPTMRWTGKVGDASVFRVWGSRAFVRDTSANKLSPHAIPCVFLGFVPDAPGWQFYHPTSRCVFPSQDV
ncbi:unnamed protein product, partial [Closterium sp. NIES-53]